MEWLRSRALKPSLIPFRAVAGSFGPVTRVTHVSLHLLHHSDLELSCAVILRAAEIPWGCCLGAMSSWPDPRPLAPQDAATIPVPLAPRQNLRSLVFSAKCLENRVSDGPILARDNLRRKASVRLRTAAVFVAELHQTSVPALFWSSAAFNFKTQRKPGPSSCLTLLRPRGDRD